jgi:lipopolysaccharide transport system ATP-binding protein
MSNIAIKVENLSKQYKIGVARYRHDSLRDHLAEWAKSLFFRNGDRSPPRAERLAPGGLQPSFSDTIWALKDVSFEIKHGEVVGIIGRNGAGKSTLLKILSQITEPTSGFADIHGRVGSLLEVGTGFHRDLTGRENIYLNGAILGMRKSEIDRKFNEIVDFSGVEQFIDTPVKRYSSGMYVRLAFAVAAHLDPDILFVDEVLSVGDLAFQQKCLGTMQAAAGSGRTVIFVSHNLVAVTNLCSRAIWFDGGKIVESGDATAVAKSYTASTSETFTERLKQVWDDMETAPGNDKIRLRRINFRPESETADSLIDVGSPFRIEIEFWSLAPQQPLLVNLCFHTVQAIAVFETISMTDPHWRGRPVPPGLFRSVCHIPRGLFNDGTYIMGVHFFGSSKLLYGKPNTAVFTVHDLERRASAYYGKIAGITRPKLQWETALLDDNACHSRHDHLS